METNNKITSEQKEEKTFQYRSYGTVSYTHLTLPTTP